MTLCESSNRKMSWQKACSVKSNLFISANASNAGGTNSKALKPSWAITSDPDPDTTIFELLMLKHDRAYLSVKSKKSMCVR